MGSITTHNNSNSPIFAGKGPTAIEGPRPVNSRKPNMGVLDSIKATAEKLTSGGNSNAAPKPFKPVGGPVSSRGIFLNTNHLTQPADVAFADVPRDAGKPGGGWDLNSDPSQAATVEKELIDQICSKPNVPPTRQQLNEFLNAIQTLDLPSIFYHLVRQLQHQNWKNRLRALHCIHELLINDAPGSKDYFATEGYGAIRALTQSMQKTVQQKALIVFELLPADLAQQNPVQEDLLGAFEGNYEEPLVDEIGDDSDSLFKNLSISDDQVLNGDSLLYPYDPPKPIQTTQPTPVQVAKPPEPSFQPVPAQPTKPSQTNPSQPTKPTQTIPSNANLLNAQVFPQQSSTPADSVKSLSEIFSTPAQQPTSKSVENINNILNPPTMTPTYYTQPGYAYPAQAGYNIYSPTVVPYYVYPGQQPTAGAFIPNTGGYTVTPTYVGLGGVGNVSTSSSTSFEFVSKETTEKKDPFDFIKVGQ
jgi:hypothetical protein